MAKNDIKKFAAKHEIDEKHIENQIDKNIMILFAENVAKDWPS